MAHFSENRWHTSQEYAAAQESNVQPQELPPQLWVYRRLSTARGSGDPQQFRITHPFHPKKGQEYELVGFAHTWGEYRVFFRLPGDLHTQSVPADWTDVEEPDAFVTCSAQRSLFRPKDLLELADLLEVLEHQSVRTTTPNV